VSPVYPTTQGKALSRFVEDADQIVVVDLAPSERATESGVPIMPAGAEGRVLVTPLRVGERLLGFLGTTHADAGHDYTRDEIVLASAVGQLVALMLEHERLLRERAEARATELALREANRRMDEFLGIASHELRTPLTVAKGNVQLAAHRVQRALYDGPVAEPQLKVRGTTQGEEHNSREGTPKERARPRQVQDQGERKTAEETPPEPVVDVALLHMLQRADRHMDRLTRLIDDLVDVSRILANKLELRLQQTDLAEIVREVVQGQRIIAAPRPIHLEMPALVQVPTVADADRLGQVVTNYLTNALKYSPAERPVTVGLHADSTLARVWVRDEGPGLSEDEQVRIWERFYQVDGVKSNISSHIGLGLGLHISRTIVERHGGQVGVVSAPGEGATFWFTLPLVASG
jgi:signal transduction histidine kinase